MCENVLGRNPWDNYKSFKLLKLKKLTILLSVIALYSCSNESNKEFLTFKAYCLESNTKTYAKFPSELAEIYNQGDTVWVNMNNHFIDDKDSMTQKCVLIK